MANRVTVDVKVGSFIRQWVMESNGSDIISLEKRTNLWAIVKQNLQLLPNDYETIQDRSEYISIELLETHARQYWNVTDDCMVKMNELYRCHISEAGQAAITRYLENQFRAHFHVYMTARFSDGKKEPIRHAIASFLQDYLLPIDDTIMARMSKDWYRFRQKNQEKYPIPIFF